MCLKDTAEVQKEHVFSYLDYFHNFIYLFHFKHLICSVC